MTTRLPGWRGRMRGYLGSIWRSDFAWHDMDCASVAGGHVQQLIGENPFAAYRGRYSDAAGALQLLRDEGVSNLGDLVSRYLPEIHPAEARVGDLAGVPVDAPTGMTIAIVNGEQLLALTPTGMGTMNRMRATRAWRVGEAHA